MLKLFLLLVSLLILSTQAFCQEIEHVCSPAIGAAGQQMAVMSTGIVKPYSLTAIVKTDQTLADGNTIAGYVTAHQARDSKGRTRIDDPSFCSWDPDHQPHQTSSIEIEDPVAKTRSWWTNGFNWQNKTVTITHVSSVPMQDPSSAQLQLRQEEQQSQAYEKLSPERKRGSIAFTVENLGTKNIAGLEAVGIKMTHVTPPGLKGNSLQLIDTEEKWVSVEYRLILFDRKIDPLLGNSTYEVTKFTAEEPDPSLFQVPADYTVREITRP